MIETGASAAELKTFEIRRALVVQTEQRNMDPTALKRGCQSALAMKQALGDSGQHVFDQESDIQNMQATHHLSLL